MVKRHSLGVLIWQTTLRLIIRCSVLPAYPRRQLAEHFAESAKLENEIKKNLAGLGYGL